MDVVQETILGPLDRTERAALQTLLAKITTALPQPAAP
jgi:hypothetical protein